jgi:predicted nucleic acid-binding protein
MSCYIDTSVLAAYYCPEPLSERAEDLILAAEHPAVSHLTRLELVSAVSRKIREGMAREDGLKIIRQFERHLFKEKLYCLLEIEEHHYSMASGWIPSSALRCELLTAFILRRLARRISPCSLLMSVLPKQRSSSGLT